jgi:microcystin-dependent protein
MLDAEHNDFVEQIDQLNTFVRGITTSTGQLRNQSAATAQALAGAQRFVATAGQTVFVTTIVYSASFTSTNVEVFDRGIKIDSNLVTVANNAGFLQVTIPVQNAGHVVFVAAFESGAGLLTRLANTGSGADGANMIGIQDTGALIAATTVEGALTEVVTSLNTLLSNLGTISNLWKRDGTNAASANIPMGGFKFTGLVDGSASTDSATVGQVSALNSTISNLGNTFVRKDGTTTMTGIFNAGNFRVSNVAAPTTGTDATNKTYVDAQLGSAAPSGLVCAFGGAVAPTGWLLCNGAAVSRTTYATLFAVVGTTYGAGDGTTTFNVPNLQGRFPIGAGNGAQKNVSGSGVLTGGTALTPRTVGQFGGEEDHIQTVAEIAPHKHGWIDGAPTPGASGAGSTGVEFGGSSAFAINTASAGLGTAFNVTPSFVVVSYIIKT